MTKLVTPTVHLNGTSTRFLLDQQLQVMGALEGVLTAMRNACPNARDFYPQGEGVALQAREAYNERFRLISELRAEYEALALEIQNLVEEYLA